MLYQLTDGRIVEMSVEDYLSLSDAELSGLLGHNCGDFVQNPFFGSVIKKIPKAEPEDGLYDGTPLTDIPPGERLSDQNTGPTDE